MNENKQWENICIKELINDTTKGENDKLITNQDYLLVTKSLIHELVNMVMLIEYSLNNIKEEKPEINENSYFMYLVEDCMSMKQLILEGREFTNDIHIERTPNNVGRLIEGIINRYRNCFVENGINIEVNGGKNIIVNCDKTKIEQSINNIVKNSIEELKECIKERKKSHYRII